MSFISLLHYFGCIENFGIFEFDYILVVVTLGGHLLGCPPLPMCTTNLINNGF